MSDRYELTIICSGRRLSGSGGYSHSERVQRYGPLVSFGYEDWLLLPRASQAEMSRYSKLQQLLATETGLSAADIENRFRELDLELQVRAKPQQETMQALDASGVLIGPSEGASEPIDHQKFDVRCRICGLHWQQREDRARRDLDKMRAAGLTEVPLLWLIERSSTG